MSGSKPMTITGIIFGFGAFIYFMIMTKIIFIPLILFILAIFFLAPFRKENDYVKRLILIISLVFTGWMISHLGFAIIPFVISFLIAYLLDPVVTFLKRKGFPRWMSSLVFILFFVGVVALISIFVFPMIFTQLNDAIRKITSLVSTVNNYLDTKKLYRVLNDIGITNDDMQKLIRKEVIPELKGFMENIFNSLLSLLTGISVLATQMLNVILVPIFAFYFLKDFHKIKLTIKSILEKKNLKFLTDLRRINDIFKVYIGWQVIAASMVGTVCSTMFSIFGIPFPIVLGVICGFLNPIPYLGFIASMVISSLTILIVEPDNMWQQVMIVIAVIGGMHIINAYFIEPYILGKRVGLHPLLLFLALFLFGGMFGFVGLLVAVPCTAALVMFFNDWKDKLQFTDFPLTDEKIN